MAVVIELDAGWFSATIEWTTVSMRPYPEYALLGTINPKFRLRAGRIEVAYECCISGERLRAFIADLHALQRGKPAPAVLRTEDDHPAEVLRFLPPVHPDADIPVRFAWSYMSGRSIPQPEARECPYDTGLGPAAGLCICGQGFTMRARHLPALIEALEDLMLEYDAVAAAMRREAS